mgnify:CR=1 FL=1
MITSSPLEKALPGRENAKDWLTLKIVECLSVPMDEESAQKLSSYNNAYNAICQWEEDEANDIKSVSNDSSSFSLDTAQAWTKKMKNEDGTQGPHWTLEQAKQIMAQRKIGYPPQCFWVILNSIYSDYSTVAKKHGLGGSLDFYVDMAKSWLDDKDAVPDKINSYYNYIVKP